MQFDPWFDPPFGEFIQVIDWISLFGCLLGWISCGVKIFVLGVTRTDWLVWRRGLLFGCLVGTALVLGAPRVQHIDPFVSLAVSWLLAAAFGAAVLVLAFRGLQRFGLARLMVEGVAVFVVGVPVPALATLLARKVMAG